MSLKKGIFIKGTPRGYGNRKVEDEWLAEIYKALSGKGPSESKRIKITLAFKVNPSSSKYMGKNLPHGPDLDNLIKMTVDGLTSLNGRGVGFLSDDDVVYSIVAKKKIVLSDDETGCLIKINSLD